MRARYSKSSIFGFPVTVHENPQENGQVHEHDPASDAAGAAPSRRGHRRRRDRRERVKGIRRLIVLLVALGLVVGAGAAAVSVLWPMVTSLTESNDYTGSGSGAVSIAVHGGDTSRTIGAALEKAGVVKTARAFNDAAAADPQSGSIQPGTYGLHVNMSAASALAMLLDPVNRTVPRVTIREGLWASEIISALAAATGRPLADYQAALKDPVVLGLPAAARGQAEGYLFPSTYEFAADATAAEQLQTMAAKSLDELRKLGVAPDKAQRVLTVASIVEAEARAGPDRSKVARVIENRLATAMPLQMDSTVHFILRRRGKVGTTTAERLSKSPYNTYLAVGLPPGPINSPGLSAMQAAVKPIPGRWIYFVTVNPETGLTRFDVDVAGHSANVKLFQTWCSAHPGIC